MTDSHRTRFFSRSHSASITRLLATASAVCALTLTATAMHAQSSGEDHPLVPRMDGTQITEYSQKTFDELTIPTGPYIWKQREWQSRTAVEGKITRIDYQGTAQSSAFQAYRTYQRALDRAGFQTRFACARKAECAIGFHIGWFELPAEGPNQFIDLDQTFYVAAELERPEGNVWAVVMAWGDSKPVVRVRIAEIEPLPEPATADAATLADELRQSGRAEVPGIFFETDRATLQPQSAAALNEMAKLLGRDDALQVFVVGHTDGSGSYEHNMTLSQERALAVVAALVEQKGIARERLTGVGVGPLAPHASNADEDGRAANRRVEIVARHDS